MMFRRKLLVVFALTVCVSVGAVAALVLVVTRNAFEKTEEQQTAALVTQFQREFTRQGDEIAHHAAAIAASDALGHMATSLNGESGDAAAYFDLARSMAETHQLDFLEFVDNRGVIISSAQWPAKFGYHETGYASLPSSSERDAFLKQEELQDSTALGLFAVRAIRVGENPIYVIAGRRLDKNFLSALDLPAGARVLLYQNRGNHFSPDLIIDASTTVIANGINRPPAKFGALIDAVRQNNQEMSGVVHWSADQADDEVFHAIPLHGIGADRSPLAILLVGTARRPYVELKRHITALALLVGGGGMVLAILLSSWAAARVTRPVEQLARAAQSVADGNWDAHVDVNGGDELGQLAESFNRMTAELRTQRERLVQTERVAAWRELARRLAHELKNPLFPLQLTVENLVRARQQIPEQFDEVFQESSRTLLAEISNLKAIIGRFSDFSKMPQPQLRQVQVNEILREVAQLFRAQSQAPGRAPIECKVELDENVGTIFADPELLHRMLSNLVLNAMDAMPHGGTLTLSSRRKDGGVEIEVADSGIGLTREECERIFTPYYTSKQHGTGLGLAIVQSVVSDHGGTITVQSEPGRGTTFLIEMPGHTSERTTAGERITGDECH